MGEPSAWTRCSGCKKDIPFESMYYVCSVSTCTRKRTGFVFCSVTCFNAHLPMMRHREAWAVEQRSPARSQWQREQAEQRERTSERESRATRTRERARMVESSSDAEAPQDILVVASKLRRFVRAVSGMNMSDRTLEVLSEHLRLLSRQAIRSAATDGRKTVLERDVPKPEPRESP
ncbi:MAG: hypothetical protein MJD61_18005 [Proteobacteria bacterium]|nr:hypothetical protein [Pseudomonadota bacterium]